MWEVGLLEILPASYLRGRVSSGRTMAKPELEPAEV